MTMTRPLPKKLIAKLLTEDVRKADAEAEAKHNVIPNTGNPQLVSQTVNYPAMEKIEGDYVAQMFELRTRLKQAQEAEQRLRTNRNEWRAVAEHLQHSASKGGTDEEGHEETDEVEENSVHPSDSPTDLGPGGGGVVEATAEGSPSYGRGYHDGSPPDPPSPGDPDGGDDPEVTEVKISEREADKAVVPS